MSSEYPPPEAPTPNDNPGEDSPVGSAFMYFTYAFSGLMILILMYLLLKKMLKECGRLGRRVVRRWNGRTIDEVQVVERGFSLAANAPVKNLSHLKTFSEEAVRRPEPAYQLRKY
jgi:hypothetical protein